MADEIESKQPAVPSNFQRKTFWAALTALGIVVIATISVGAIILGSKALGYLQPILVPIAIAAIIAYLLDPIIAWFRRLTRWSYNASMLSVFSVFMAMIVLLGVAVVVPSFGQAWEVGKKWNANQTHITETVRKGINDLQAKFDTNPTVRKYWDKYYDSGIKWLTEEGPKMGQIVGAWTWERLMGAFGFFGYLLGLILVPVYLFFFLKESYKIKTTWSDYLPLRASNFKDEVVETLQEINQYLVAFFRGQMVVSLIDGALVALALAFILHLPYALLIGVFLAILGLIPYIGNLVVMIPAVLIAIGHFGERGHTSLPFSSDLVAGQVIVVNVDDENKNRYVTAVENVTWVTVLEKGEILKGYVPYVAPAAPAADPTAAATPASTPPVEAASVGKKMNIKLENGTTVNKEINSILESGKRAEFMKNTWSFLPNMWFYPLIVIAIFVILQQINGFFTAPKIVGDSVGLHPLTVIFSVLFWSFLLGGLLGALLAVPMTASIKVLFRRYIWAKRIEPNTVKSIASRNEAQATTP